MTDTPVQGKHWPRIRQDPNLADAVRDLATAVRLRRISAEKIACIANTYAAQRGLTEYVDRDLHIAIEIFIASCRWANFNESLVVRVVQRFRQATVPAKELMEDYVLPAIATATP